VPQAASTVLTGVLNAAAERTLPKRRRGTRGQTPLCPACRWWLVFLTSPKKGFYGKVLRAGTS